MSNELRKQIQNAGMELYAQGTADASETLRQGLEAVAIKLGDTPFGPGLRVALAVITDAAKEMKKVADDL